jgi:hypothetical protein
MIELFVEKNNVDIDKSFSVMLTLAIDDIKDFSAKNTTFSKTIILPGTNKNNALFGNIFDINVGNEYNSLLPNKGINFNASVSANAIIFSDNIQVFKGTFRLLEIVIDNGLIEYEAVVFGELGGFISKLGTAKLEDLDFSEYNHTYSIANIENSWSLASTTTKVASAGGLTFISNKLIIYAYNIANVGSGDTITITGTSNNGTYTIKEIEYDGNDTTITITTTFAIGQNTSGTVVFNFKKGYGYYYPLVDYGNYSTNKIDYKVGTFRPALFAREYLNKIKLGTGYTWDFPLIDSKRFKGLVVPHNRKTLEVKSPYILDVSTPIDTNAYNYNLVKDNEIDDETTAIRCDTLTLLGAFTSSTFVRDQEPNVPQSLFTYTGTDPKTGDVILSLGLTVVSNHFTNIYVYVYVNNTAIYTSNIIGNTTGVFYYDTVINSVTFNNGDVLSVKVTGVRAGTVGYPHTANFFVDYVYLKVKNSADVYVPVGLGDTVIINDTLPKNYLQKDFLSSIIKLFNLYIFEDRTKDKHLQIMPFVDFYANAQTNDFSNKIDRSQPLRIKPMSELNSRYYEFKFKDDSDYYNDLYKKRYNESYGSYKYDSGFEFAKDSTTIELVFSGTPLLGYNTTDKVVSAIFKRTGTDTAPVEENTDSNIRLLQAKLVTGVNSWNIKNADGSANLGTYTQYPYAGHFDDPDAPSNDIQFGVPKELFFQLASGSINVNQFNVYWSSYMAEITDKDSKLLTCKAKLSNTDVFNIDFSKLIWIDGSLFRLNKIIDFNASNKDTCTIELLKIINKIY